ncbi:MAG: hypothetical protein ACOC9Q_03560 [bacterium]
MLRLGSAALTALVLLAAGYYLGWSARSDQVEALKAGIERAEAQAQARAREIEAEGVKEQAELDRREQALNALWERISKQIRQQEVGECEVPAALMKRLNALDY